MDISMIRIQAHDGAAQVVRCEDDGACERALSAMNAPDLAEQAARVVAELGGAPAEDGLYLCTNELQAAVQIPPLVLPADAISLGEAGRLLCPDASQHERWGRTHAMRKANTLRVYRVGIGEETRQYASQAAVVRLAERLVGAA